MSFGAKLKSCRKNMSLSQKEFGQKIGVAESTVSLYESNKRFPDPETLKKISTLFNISIDYLLGNSPEKLPNQKSSGRGIRIPVLGRVVAGIPIEATQEILGYEEITPDLAKTGEFFALQVKGDSMLPKLEEGDIVIVKCQEDVETGDIAIVLVNGDEATIKQVKKVDGGIMLYGFNSDVYAPHFYSNQQIEALPVRILGKVIESRRSW